MASTRKGRSPGPKSCGSVSYLLLSGEQPLPHGRIGMMLILLTDRAKPSHTKLSHPKVFLSGVWRKRWWNGQIKWLSPVTTLRCYSVFATQMIASERKPRLWACAMASLSFSTLGCVLDIEANPQAHTVSWSWILLSAWNIFSCFKFFLPNFKLSVLL